MSRSRRTGGRSEANIWPGFVDAMTALLLVIMFVLSIFMIIQFVLRETITGQESELGNLSAQVSSLAQALGMEQQRGTDLSNQLGRLDSQLDDAEDDLRRQSILISSLSNARDAAQVEIASFEEQVASLISQNTVLNTRNSTLQTALQSSAQLAENQANRLKDQDNALAEQESQLGVTRDQLAELEIARELELTQKEAAQLALARARSEIDNDVEQARLAAAKADALQALIEDMQAQAAAADSKLAALESDANNADAITAELAAEAEALKAAALAAENEIAALTDAEKNRLLEAAAADALRARLRSADTELTAMTLALEEQRRNAEDTLTLLAAAKLAQERLDNSEAENLDEIDRQEALLEQANALLSTERALSADSLRQVALLNSQTADLRKQLNLLQGLLDASAENDRESQVQISTLSTNLNTAIAKIALSERARADMEARENERLIAEALALEAEVVDLRSFRSEFFAEISEVLAEQEGVQVDGDRFVFASGVLFDAGSAELGAGGQAQIRSIATIIRTIDSEIPDYINWVLRVDGHTDSTRLGSTSEFADNWELSQARALSVVKYLVDHENIPANRLAATGFGEFQPVNPGDSPEALAENRRIELKLTEK